MRLVRIVSVNSSTGIDASGADLEHSRVVDQDIRRASERTGDREGHACDRFGVGDVAWGDNGVWAELGGKLLECLGVTGDKGDASTASDSWRAMAAPIPREAPVTRAVVP